MSYAAVKTRMERGEMIILDGAIGTEMCRRGLTWEGHKVESEPDAIRSIHADYILAGADILSTNTFQLAKRSFLNHFADLEHMRHIGAQHLETCAAGLIRDAVQLALEARRRSSRPAEVAVAGAMTTLEWCFRPDLAPEENAMRAEYREIISDFKAAGVDLMLFETVNRWQEAKVALEAARELDIPAWVSFVPDWRARLLSGESVAQMVCQLEPLAPDAILFNCAPPADCTLALRELAKHSKRPFGAYAHIGRFDPPDWMFTDEYPPQKYLEAATEWVAAGAQLIGGCCGTTPDHIRLLKDALPRRAAVHA